MSALLLIFAASCLLAYVHIFAAGAAKTKQYGRKWNIGPRDEDLPEPSPIVGRLMRADANYRENFVVFVPLLIAILVAGKAGPVAIAGGIVWLSARILYLPVYAAGITGWRTAIYLVSLIGTAMLLWQLVV